MKYQKSKQKVEKNKMSPPQKKRKRAQNFTLREIEELFLILEKFKAILLCKTTDSALSRQKPRAWRQIYEEFNKNRDASEQRTLRQLKDAYDREALKFRNQRVSENNERFATGGGSYHPRETQSNPTTTFFDGHTAVTILVNTDSASERYGSSLYDDVGKMWDIETGQIVFRPGVGPIAGGSGMAQPTPRRCTDLSHNSPPRLRHQTSESQQRDPQSVVPQRGESQQRDPQPVVPQRGESRQRDPQPVIPQRGESQQRDPQPVIPQRGESQQSDPQPVIPVIPQRGESQQSDSQPVIPQRGESQQRDPQPVIPQRGESQQSDPQPRIQADVRYNELLNSRQIQQAVQRERGRAVQNLESAKRDAFVAIAGAANALRDSTQQESSSRLEEDNLRKELLREQILEVRTRRLRQTRQDD